jgi:RNA ligase (TIGR02306 family)
MRKLASIKRISDITRIPEADKICAYNIGGWTVVDAIGKYKIDDLVIMIEIDSWVPTTIAPFLTKKDKNPSKYNGVQGEKIRSIKLKGQISQGLLLPMSVLPNPTELKIGDDVTDLLGIEKYEPPIPAQIVGDARSFSWPISKTDETRVQLDDEYGFIERLSGKPYYISLKLDGTSSTFLIDPKDETFHVCGRNYSYKRNDTHTFWKIAQRYNIEQKLRYFWDKGNNRIAIQGEIVGPGIQKNPLGLSVPDLYIFNVIDIADNTRFSLGMSMFIVQELGLKFVPIVDKGSSFAYTKTDLLEMAKGKYKTHFSSAKDSQDREGIVIRSMCGNISFKAINNDFLLKE